MPADEAAPPLSASPGEQVARSALCAAGLLVLGGAWQREEARFNCDTRLLWHSLASSQWRDVAASGEPPPGCYRHAACLVGNAKARTEAVAVWGGYTLEPLEVTPGNEERLAMNARALHLLSLPACHWSAPRTHGVPPEPRGGHSMTQVGDLLLIFGGGQLTHDGPHWYEVDLDGVHYLDVPTLTFGECEERGERPEPRGGHTAHLLLRDGQLGCLMLGGRDYPKSAHRNAQLGRAEAHWLALV